MTDPVASGYGYHAVENYGSPHALTGESLMIWLSVKLGSIDEDLQSMMDNQTKALKDKEVLQKYKQCLSEIKDALGRDDRAAADAAINEFGQYVFSLGQGPGGALAQAKWVAYGEEHAGVPRSQGDWDIAITEVTNEIEALDKNSEMSMIRINQLMSQRQTAVQLTQSIMNKQNETIEGIVKKFG